MGGIARPASRGLNLVRVREQEEAFPVGHNLDLDLDFDLFALDHSLYPALLLTGYDKKRIGKLFVVVPRFGCWEITINS